MAATLAQAHPHSWIDVRSQVQVSSNGLVTAFTQEWTFDELYTTYVIEEMAAGKRPTPAVVSQFAPKVIANLQPYGYFLEVTVDGKPAPLGKAREFSSVLDGQRLRLKFTAPLAIPVDPVRQALRFAVYDPTYYIDMQHRQPSDAVLAGGTIPCRLETRRPQPGADLMARAFAMDKNAVADDTLGRQFAQTVTLACK